MTPRFLSPRWMCRWINRLLRTNPTGWAIHKPASQHHRNALGELAAGNAKRLLLKETGLGLIHGIAVGLLVGGIAFAWKGNPWPALVAGLSRTANMMVAGISGVLAPLGFRAMMIDPALASAVAVTTATDVVGFFIYLGLTTLMITLIVGG